MSFFETLTPEQRHSLLEEFLHSPDDYEKEKIRLWNDEQQALRTVQENMEAAQMIAKKRNNPADSVISGVNVKKLF